MMLVVAAIGALSGVGGLFGSYHLDVASGPAIVLYASACSCWRLLFAPRRGMLWRRWAQRRSRAAAIGDDLLKELLAGRTRGGPAPVGALAGRTPGPARSRPAAVVGAAGARRPLVLLAGRIVLSEAGERRATQLVRVQRLLETYLHDVESVPIENIRAQADAREHGLSAEAVEEMARLLGDPHTDPHGHPIPQRQARPRANCAASPASCWRRWRQDTAGASA